MAIQDKLRSLRKTKELSVKKLSKDSGVSEAYLHQLEYGIRKNPSGDVLRKLALALGATVADLIGAPVTISEEALRDVSASLQALTREKGEQLGLRQEDLKMLGQIHFRGRQPNTEEDWELIFLFLKRLLG